MRSGCDGCYVWDQPAQQSGSGRGDGNLYSRTGGTRFLRNTPRRLLWPCSRWSALARGFACGSAELRDQFCFSARLKPLELVCRSHAVVQCFCRLLVGLLMYRGLFADWCFLSTRCVGCLVLVLGFMYTIFSFLARQSQTRCTHRVWRAGGG